MPPVIRPRFMAGSSPQSRSVAPRPPARGRGGTPPPTPATTTVQQQMTKYSQKKPVADVVLPGMNRTTMQMEMFEEEIVSAVRKTSRGLSGNVSFLRAQVSDDEPATNTVRDENAWQLYRASERNKYTSQELEAIFVQVHEFLPTDIADDIRSYWILGETTVIPNIEMMLLGARDRYLHAIFAETAQQINLPELTNMSDAAMTVFMLSQTRLERWDNYMDIFPGSDPAELVIHDSTTYVAAATFETLVGVFGGNIRKPQRISAASLGSANFYIPQLVEAVQFMNALANNPLAYAVSPQEINTDIDVGYQSSFIGFIADPIQATAALSYIMNWAGARQMMGEGAGSQNNPAITSLNFGVQTREVDQISALSLANVRYNDAVDAEITFSSEVANPGGDFWKALRVIEATPANAQALGYTMGYGAENDVQIGRDFLPYNREQAIGLVAAMRNAIFNQSTGWENALANLCASVLLQQEYFSATGTGATDGISCL